MTKMTRQELVALRRENLSLWIRDHYENQADFVKKWDLNQSEISGLLRNKSFGEVKARNLEDSCDMPYRYLDTPRGAHTSEPVKNKTTIDHITIQQYKDVRGAMGKGAYLLDKEGEVIDWRVTKQWANNNLPANTGVENLRIITGLGDSMKGLYNSGDPLIIDIGVKAVEFDAVYFFRVDNEGYVKRLQKTPEGIIVISQNKDYRDWTIKDGMDFEVFGRVLKVWEGKEL